MRKFTFVLLWIAVFLLGTLFATANAQDATPDPSQTDTETPAVAVTIYNQGTALVQDRRTFTLQAGENVIDFTDVAALIDPTSVSFNSLTDPLGTFVLEQNYIFDLVGSSALLERYLDETIQLTLDDGTQISGQLLSGRNGEIILRDANGSVMVVSAAQVRDMRFPALPDGLITRPTLRWLIDSTSGGDQLVELTYLTGGVNWTADYIILLGEGSTSLDLNGWVTFTNTSGTTFTDAQIKLIAGDVNRVQEQQMVMSMADMGGEAADERAAQTEQRNFNEYQLYEIVRRVTLNDNETKQVEFVTGADVPANTFFVYDSSPYYYGYVVSDQYYGQTGVTDVQNWLEFSTAEDGGLGADMPAGRVRVYQEDVDGSALLIGENRIDHTPEGETVQMYLGNAFDLVGGRTQTDFRLIGDRVLEETYEIRLRNRKDDQAVEIRVPERLFRWTNWEILSSSHEYTQLDSNTIEYRVTVQPGEEVVITYTVRYDW
jgi:hypothetical protein